MSFSNICLLFFSAWLLIVTHVKPISAKNGRSNYIIHMDKSHMPQSSNNSHHHWYSSIVDSLKHHSSNDNSFPSILYSYDTVSHGFSARLSLEELEALKAIPGFVSAYTDKPGVMHTTRSPDFLSLSPSSGIWPASKFGEDVIIGVVDTGVWPESKSFSDRVMTGKIPAKWRGKCEEGKEFNSSMCNRKLIGARFFSKALMANSPELEISMNSPRDTNGHGTHTASTAAGNTVSDVSFFGYAKGTASGIAPRARVACYKAVFDEGNTGSDVMAAIEKAVEDGVDVLSLSLAIRGVPLYEDPVAKATFAAMERGVVVSASAGNDGPHAGTLSNGIPWLTTVAAGTMDRSFGGTVRLGNGVTIAGWSLFPASALIEEYSLVYNKTLAGCNSTALLTEARFDGVIVCDDTWPVLEQIKAVTESQMVGAIFITDDPRIFELAFITCAAAFISPKHAPTLIKYATKEEPFVSIKFQRTFHGTKPAPAVSSYSSRGPSISYQNILKPDIMAPGTRVLAAWSPVAQAAQIGSSVPLMSDYNLQSGTSMSCPHISGVTALLKSVHPMWSPAAIRSAMMTTANPLDNTNKPITDDGDDSNLASPLTMGSGQVNPNKALDPGLIYDAARQDYINLLCSMNFTHEQIMSITRSKAYDCSNPSSDLNYPSFIALYDKSTRLWARKFTRVVTNVGDGPATYNVEVTAPKGSTVKVSPKRLVFSEKYKKQRYNVEVKYNRDKEGRVTFGDLVWVEENGKYRVRSPIVVSPFVITT